MNGMKLSGIVLRTMLILTVALSLVLSWFIWLNPSRLERRENTTPAVAIKVTDTRTAATQESSVYLPTMAYYQQNQQKQLLYQDGQDVVSQLHKALTKTTLTSMAKTEKLTGDDFETLISQNDTLQLVYPDVMAFSLFKRQFFDSPLKTNLDFKFTRVILSLQAKTKTVTLVNDATRQTYTGKLEHLDDAKLMKIIKPNATGRFVLVEQRFGQREVPLFTQSVAIRPYTYLLDRQGVSHYIPALLTADGQSRDTVDARELGSDTVYTIGSTRRLSMNNDSGDMQFEDSAATTAPTDMGKFFGRTFASLDNLALPSLTTMRYFAYDTTENAVTYRSFVQNFAIFNQTSNGTVKVTYAKNSLQMDFSSDNVTVPIPTTEKNVTLPSTTAVLSQLHARGYTDEHINNIVLGYHWVKQAKTDLVVDLQPTYYVQIDGSYKAYQNWLDTTPTNVQGGDN